MIRGSSSARAHALPQAQGAPLRAPVPRACFLVYAGSRGTRFHGFIGARRWQRRRQSRHPATSAAQHPSAWRWRCWRPPARWRRRRVRGTRSSFTPWLLASAGRGCAGGAGWSARAQPRARATAARLASPRLAAYRAAAQSRARRSRSRWLRCRARVCRWTGRRRCRMAAGEAERARRGKERCAARRVSFCHCQPPARSPLTGYVVEYDTAPATAPVAALALRTRAVRTLAPLCVAGQRAALCPTLPAARSPP